jgi:hypothetical protein
LYNQRTLQEKLQRREQPLRFRLGAIKSEKKSRKTKTKTQERQEERDKARAWALDRAHKKGDRKQAPL